MVDILNAFFQEYVGDHRHNNLEISERGGELGGGEGRAAIPRSTSGCSTGWSERYNFIDGSGNNLADNAAAPESGTSQLASSIRPRLGYDRPGAGSMCAFKPFRNDPSRAQLAVARKISIIHVAYTITISSLSLSLSLSSIVLFDCKKWKSCEWIYHPLISRSLS